MDDCSIKSCLSRQLDIRPRSLHRFELLYLYIYIVLDELVDAFKGYSPVKTYFPKKPHSNGHLIYEAVSIDKNTHLPYLYAFLPYLKKRPKTTKVFETLCVNVPSGTHIIADSWFPSAGNFGLQFYLIKISKKALLI